MPFPTVIAKTWPTTPLRCKSLLIWTLKACKVVYKQNLWDQTPESKPTQQIPLKSIDDCHNCKHIRFKRVLKLTFAAFGKPRKTRGPLLMNGSVYACRLIVWTHRAVWQSHAYSQCLLGMRIRIHQWGVFMKLMNLTWNWKN